MIMDSSLAQNAVYQQYIYQIWTSIKQNHSLSDVCDKNFVQNLLKARILEDKKNSSIRSFLINELSQLLPKILKDESAFDFLNKFSGVSFNVSFI